MVGGDGIGKARTQTRDARCTTALHRYIATYTLPTRLSRRLNVIFLSKKIEIVFSCKCTAINVVLFTTLKNLFYSLYLKSK